MIRQHSLVRRLITAVVVLWYFQETILSYSRYNSLEPPRREDGQFHAQDIAVTPLVIALCTQPVQIVMFTVVAAPIPILCSPHLEVVEILWFVTAQCFIGYCSYHFMYLTQKEFITKVN